MAKKRVLPKNFFRSMGAASLEELIAVYDDCLLTAYQGGDRARQTPLFWALTPNALVEWLIAQGLDVDSTDALGVSPLFAQADRAATYPEGPQNHPGKVRLLLSLGADVHRGNPSHFGGGFTALHIAAIRGAGRAVETLLEYGAEADAVDEAGRTSLEWATSRADLRTLSGLAGVAAPLIGAGATVTPEMRERIVLVGRELDALRAGSTEAHAAARDAAFAPLVSLFGLDDAGADAPQDAEKEVAGPEILVPRASLDGQHRALWNALVPGSGPAATVQGEVIRITGRVADEMEEMGGVNWDESYRAMLAHLLVLLARGTPLDETARSQVADTVRLLSSGRYTQETSRRITRLRQAAVDWVSANRAPIPMDPPPYHR